MLGLLVCTRRKWQRTGKGSNAIHRLFQSDAAINAGRSWGNKQHQQHRRGNQVWLDGTVNLSSMELRTARWIARRPSTDVILSRR
jgi:hypothetical protein